MNHVFDTQHKESNLLAHGGTQSNFRHVLFIPQSRGTGRVSQIALRLYHTLVVDVALV